MKTITTLEELAQGLLDIRGSIRVGWRRGAFACVVEFTGGTATFSNAELPRALGAAVGFLYQHSPYVEAIEPVEADPNGAHVGPAPTGTIVGSHSHCAHCGYGEKTGQVYIFGGDCPSCGARRACAAPNNHEGNHTPCERS
jgi:hypothetical protein